MARPLDHAIRDWRYPALLQHACHILQLLLCRRSVFSQPKLSREMTLVLLNVLLFDNTALFEQKVVPFICAHLESFTRSECLLLSDCQEVFERRQALESNLLPSGRACPSYESKPHFRRRFRHPGMFERNNRPFGRCDALGFVERHRPSQSQRQPYTGDRFGLFACHFLRRYWNPSSRQALEARRANIIGKMNNDEIW